MNEFTVVLCKLYLAYKLKQVFIFSSLWSTPGTQGTQPWMSALCGDAENALQ